MHIFTLSDIHKNKNNDFVLQYLNTNHLWYRRKWPNHGLKQPTIFFYMMEP